MKALVLDGSGSDDIAGAIGEASRKTGFETDAVRQAVSPGFDASALAAAMGLAVVIVLAGQGRRRRWQDSSVVKW